MASQKVKNLTFLSFRVYREISVNKGFIRFLHVERNDAVILFASPSIRKDMKNAIRIYKIILKYWVFLFFNLIFMLFYALFSGVSITMVSPLLDFVFINSERMIKIDSYSLFFEKITQTITDFFATHSLFHLNKEIVALFIEEIKNVFSQTNPLLLLWIISFAFISLILLKNLFFFLNRLMTTNLKGLAVRDLRDMIFAKYLTQSLKFLNKNRIGDALVRMVSDVQIICEQYIGAIFVILRNLFMIIIFIQIAIFLNPKLFFISLILLPFFGILINQLGKKLKKYAKRQQGQYSDMFSFMEEVLSSIKIVKAFSRENSEMSNFSAVNQRYFRFWRRGNIYASLNVPISEISSVVTGAVLLIIGGKMIITGNDAFTVGNFMAFLFAFFSMLHPLKELTDSYANIKKANVSMDRVVEILDQPNDIIESKNAVAKKDFVHKISMQNLSFGFLPEQFVLKNITLEIHKGEKIAFVGNSGSGKTTLVNMLNRMYDPSNGTILIDAIPLTEMKLQDLRKLFGVVTQDSMLFSASVRDNIAYGSLQSVSDEDIKKAAKIAFADEFVERLPKQYNEILNPKASNLSGGEKQRLCIARAVVDNPPILIFDEATSSLDSEAEQKVQKAIEMATQDRTVIMIAHRLSTILKADKIVVIDQGEIVGMGKHEELLETCAKYKLLYDIQFKG
jgi:subfamily B ATP-binding cassette protein MsbA